MTPKNLSTSGIAKEIPQAKLQMEQAIGNGGCEKPSNLKRKKRRGVYLYDEKQK